MSRLTVNEAGTSGYTDEIILTPGDFTTAAGNTTTQVDIPVGFIANHNANTTGTKVNTGSALDDGGDASNVRIVAAADGNITIASASALDGSTSGKMKVLLSIKRVNA
jgi:hypothetical protein